MFPDADVPVVQLSINALKPLEYHLELAARLAVLRDKGVMIVASGNVVHNLRLIDWDAVDEGFDRAHRFDEAVHDHITRGPADEKIIPTFRRIYRIRDGRTFEEAGEALAA